MGSVFLFLGGLTAGMGQRETGSIFQWLCAGAAPALGRGPVRGSPARDSRQRRERSDLVPEGGNGHLTFDKWGYRK